MPIIDYKNPQTNLLSILRINKLWVLQIMFLFVILFTQQTQTLNNKVGLSPPMGWNSWNHYGCNISEDIIIKTADYMLKNGLAAKGYKYIHIDDCWQIARDQTTGQIIPDPNKFPNGIKYLADYVHKKGLLLGIYSSAGQKTCQGRPGSYGYEQLDAQTYAKWQVDYLKYDNCYTNVGKTQKQLYYRMYKALMATNRPIFYSICNWGTDNPWQWSGLIANSWRTTQDINDTWQSFTSILDRQNGLEVYAGKGGWNDPDMLEVGNGGMTHNQYQAHFVMWSILKAPLLLGCDLTKISSSLLEIVGNQQLIAINQDPLGIQAKRIVKKVRSQGTTEVWAGLLSKQSWVVVFLNLGQLSTTIQINIQDIIKKRFKHYDVRNILLHRDEGRSTDQFISDQLQTRTASAYILAFDGPQGDNLKKIRTFNSKQFVNSKQVAYQSQK